MAEFRIAPGREGQFTGVAPALIAILKTAAANAPPNVSVVEAFSGNAARGTGTTNHPNGKAVDVRLIDTNGTVLPNSPQDAARRGVPLAPAFRTYEQFAQAAKVAQQQIAPDSPFRWGGYFVQGQPFDLMHFDVTSNNMAGGTWKGGLTADRARALTAFNDIPPVSVGIGPLPPGGAMLAGITSGSDLAAHYFQRQPPAGVPPATAFTNVPMPNLRPAQKAIATNFPIAPLKPTGVAGSGSGASISGRIGLLPTPPASIPSTPPDMKTSTGWQGSTLQPDVMNASVSSKSVPPGVGADFIKAILDASNAWVGGDIKIALAAKNLASQDPRAVSDYFSSLKATHPEVIRSAGAISQQRPDLFKVLKDNASPKQLAPLTAGMTPQPNFRPTKPPFPLLPIGGTPVPLAATGNTYPSPPADNYNANAAQSAAARARITPALLQQAYTNRTAPNPQLAGMGRVPSNQPLSAAERGNWPLVNSMVSTPAQWGMVPAPTVFGSVGRNDPPTINGARPAAYANMPPVAPPRSGYSEVPSYYSMASGNQPPVDDMSIDMAPYKTVPATPYASNPYPDLVPQLVPLIKKLAPVINQALSYPQGQKTVGRAAPTGPGQSLNAARQMFSPPSGSLPLTAPASGGYVSSPSTFGGVAYVSTNSAGQRIATNAQGATIRLS